MVTAQPNSSISNHHSHTASGDTNNPNFPRKNLTSPWAQVVRGAESEPPSVIHQSPPSSSSASSSVSDHPPPPPPSSSSAASASPPLENSNMAAVDNSDANNTNAGRSNRPVWNTLANGDVNVGPVMGAVSWPALSKSVIHSAKSPAESSSKASTDGSVQNSQAPVTSHTSHKQAASNAKPNFATNHSTYNRHRPMMKRGGGGSNIGAGPAQSSFPNPPLPPPPPPFPLYQIPPTSYNAVVPVVPDPSPRELLYKNSWDPRPSVGGFMPVVNDHRNSSRRGSFVPRPRADGTYHNNYGGRRDQDRGNYANSRDPHVNQPRMPPRGLMRPLPPNSAAFVAPQPLAPFPNPVGFPEYCYYPTLPLEPFRGMPFLTHPPPPAMFIPVAEPPPTEKIVRQIDYYFSDANLWRDEFLRRNMDEQGWVQISLIASFPRVKNLTSEISVIVDSLKTSTVVEVQGDKVRRRNDWMAWLLPPRLQADTASMSPGGSNHNNVDTTLTSPGGSNHSNVDIALTSPAVSNHSDCVADLEKISLKESSTDKVNLSPVSDVYQARSAAKASSSAQLPNGDVIDNASPQLPNGDAIDNAS